MLTNSKLNHNQYKNFLNEKKSRKQKEYFLTEKNLKSFIKKEIKTESNKLLQKIDEKNVNTYYKGNEIKSLIEIEEIKKWDKLIDELYIKSISNNKIASFKRRELYIQKGIYDSLSDDEDEESENYYFKSNSLIISQNDYLFLIIKIFVFFSILFSIIIIPYNNCFDIHRKNNNYSHYYYIILDLIFILEFIFNFFTGFEFEDETIHKQKYIILNYIFSLIFIIDFICIFPIHTILSLFSKQTIFIYLLWFKVILIIKLLKISNYFIYKIFKFEEFENITKKINLFKIFILMLLMIHNLSCLWIYIGNLEIYYNEFSWLKNLILNNENYLLSSQYSNFDIYVISIYFHFVSIFSIGFGDIYPITVKEKGYISFFLLFSTQLFTFIISWISSMISEISKKEENYSKGIEILKEISHEYNIPEILENKLKKNLIFIKNNYSTDKHTLIEELPQELKNQLFKKIYEKKLTKVHFFNFANEDFIMYVTPKMQHFSLKKFENIITIGDIFTEMIIINKGAVNFFLSPIYHNYKLLTINKGNHFGDVNMFLGERSEFTIKSSLNQTEIFSLKMSIYTDLKINFPEIINKITEKSLENYIALEDLRKDAINYYNKNKSFDRFKYLKIKKNKSEFVKKFKMEEEKENILKFKNDKLLITNNKALSYFADIKQETCLLDENDFNYYKFKLNKKSYKEDKYMYFKRKNIDNINKKKKKIQISNKNYIEQIVDLSFLYKSSLYHKENYFKENTINNYEHQNKKMEKTKFNICKNTNNINTIILKNSNDFINLNNRKHTIKKINENKTIIIKNEFEKRLEDNAFFENKKNIFGDYLKDLLTKKQENKLKGRRIFDFLKKKEKKELK